MKCALTLAAVWIVVLANARAASVDYGRDILPILSDKCYHCHGPDEKARKAKLRLDVKEIALRTNKPIIIPGQSRESELVSRITTTNLDDWSHAWIFGGDESRASSRNSPGVRPRSLRRARRR